jgi:hypothetical protein
MYKHECIDLDEKNGDPDLTTYFFRFAFEKI